MKSFKIKELKDEVKIELIISKKTFLKSLPILAAIILMVLLRFKPGSIVFTAYFLAVFLFSIESRVSISLGLITLLMSLVALIFKSQPLAETYAEYTYLFLAIGVITALIEYLRKPEEEKS